MFGSLSCWARVTHIKKNDMLKAIIYFFFQSIRKDLWECLS